MEQTHWDLAQTAAYLSGRDNIVLLAHQKPDGDTLGSCFALCFALEAMGKNVRVECADPLPVRFGFIWGDQQYHPPAFVQETVVAVDVADIRLLGSMAEKYPQIDLCIDHHRSHKPFARQLLLDVESPATTQVIFELLQQLEAPITPLMAGALFTGLSTDTGCFKYDNVTPKTHLVAARLIELGAEHGRINKLMFDTVSKGRLAAENSIRTTLEYFFDGRCALITLPQDVAAQFGVSEDELDGISSFPVRIEGVLAGVTLRDSGGGQYRISLRTTGGADASAICGALGGGGHRGAAGCTVSGQLEEVRQQVLQQVEKELQRLAI